MAANLLPGHSGATPERRTPQSLSRTSRAPRPASFSRKRDDAFLAVANWKSKPAPPTNWNVIYWMTFRLKQAEWCRGECHPLDDMWLTDGRAPALLRGCS